MHSPYKELIKRLLQIQEGGDPIGILVTGNEKTSALLDAMCASQVREHKTFTGSLEQLGPLYKIAELLIENPEDHKGEERNVLENCVAGWLGQLLSLGQYGHIPTHTRDCIKKSRRFSEEVIFHAVLLDRLGPEDREPLITRTIWADYFDTRGAHAGFSRGAPTTFPNDETQAAWTTGLTDLARRVIEEQRAKVAKYKAALPPPTPQEEKERQFKNQHITQMMAAQQAEPSKARATNAELLSEYPHPETPLADNARPPFLSYLLTEMSNALIVGEFPQLAAKFGDVFTKHPDYTTYLLQQATCTLDRWPNGLLEIGECKVTDPTHSWTQFVHPEAARDFILQKTRVTDTWGNTPVTYPTESLTVQNALEEKLKQLTIRILQEKITSHKGELTR